MNLNRILSLIPVCLITVCLNPGHSFAEGSPNYSQLERQCQGEKDAGCCLKGVRKMKEGHFTEAQDGKCPEGSKKNSLPCSGGKEWCESPDRRT